MQAISVAMQVEWKGLEQVQQDASQWVFSARNIEIAALSDVMSGTHVGFLAAITTMKGLMNVDTAAHLVPAPHKHAGNARIISFHIILKKYFLLY